MSEPPFDAEELVRARRECELYRRLLRLGEETALEPLLQEALSLIVDVAGARQGYLELHIEEAPGREQSWSMSHGFSAEEVAGVQVAVSRGIIAEAVATGQTIVTASALE